MPPAPVWPPLTLSREEVQSLLAQVQDVSWLTASLLYGAGLRLLECLRLRIQDVDFGWRELTVRSGKGGKDRRTMLPATLVEPLLAQVAEARRVHARDLAAGFGEVWLPHPLARSYLNASRKTGWQYVFPAESRSGRSQSDLRRRQIGVGPLDRLTGRGRLAVTGGNVEG